MVKIVKDDWEFKVARIGGKIFYSAHYAVSSEGVEQDRDMIVEFSAQEETQIANFIMNIVRPKVEAKEGTNGT